uniref:Eukaryotic translation initiation factor 3 subunit G n=2 Tax=Mesocestoides corti TaxID=53468 RepID=A0A5K3F789_MESCO
MAASKVLTLPKNAPLPEQQVIYDRENNTKLVISYESDDDGEIYMETREYTIEKVRVSSAVAKRKAWKKFGESAEDPPGPNPANTYPGEIVNIQYLENKLAETAGKALAEEEAAKLTAKPKQAVTCRTCKGAHFSHQCPFRSEMEALRSFIDSTSGPGGQGPDPVTKAAAQEIAPELNSGRYIPPTLRAAAAAANGVVPGATTERRRLEGYSIRVANLPENTRETDLREIFGCFGEIIRIYPARDRRTQLNRGFAYISYAKCEDAATAMYFARGMHYGHMILNVDWAQPLNN